jgi:hypothetical protein
MRPPTSTSASRASSAILRTATAFISGVSRRQVCGKSGRNNATIMPSAIVIVPSMTAKPLARWYSHSTEVVLTVKPLPCLISSNTVEAAKNPGSNQVTKSSRNQGPGIEDGHAKVELLFGVPFRQVEQYSRKERRFYNSQNQTTYDDASRTGDLRGQG